MAKKLQLFSILRPLSGGKKGEKRADIRREREGSHIDNRYRQRKATATAATREEDVETKGGSIEERERKQKQK